jgi:hypothetical protein
MEGIMDGINKAMFAACLIGSIGFADAAMAQGQGGGEGRTLAPGQLNTSPGQDFNANRDLGAQPPGQQFNADRNDPLATPTKPGQTFDNLGRSKQQ